jgi:hypothetical protein
MTGNPLEDRLLQGGDLAEPLLENRLNIFGAEPIQVLDADEAFRRPARHALCDALGKAWANELGRKQRDRAVPPAADLAGSARYPS